MFHNGRKIPLGRTSPEHIPYYNDELRSFFMNSHGSNISEILCINKNDQNSLEITGDFAGGNFKYLEVKIKPCENSTSKDPNATVCAPWEIIENKLLLSYFSVYAIDSL
jgi:hypothetical protein